MKLEDDEKTEAICAQLAVPLQQTRRGKKKEEES